MTGPVLLEENVARQVVLVEAVETTDARSALIGDAERERAEGAVLQRLGHVPGQPVDPARFLPARAAEILVHVESRQPRLAALQRAPAWGPLLAWAVPAIALVAGFASDRIGNPRQLDLLSLPLLGFVAWNFAVFAWLAALALVPRWGHAVRARMQPVVDACMGIANVGARRDIATAFRRQWSRVSGGLDEARLRRALHVAAAAWALGLVLSIVWTGLAREYRVGWESTWLGAGQVHALVQAIAWPGRALAGMEGFTLEQVQGLNFRSGRAPGQEEARQWAVLYIVFLLAAVVLPRLVFAAYAGWRAHRLARRVRLQLDAPYFAHMLARLNPVRIALVPGTDDAQWRAALDCLLRQASAPGDGGARLRTAQGDELVVDEGATDPAALRVQLRALESWPDALACWPLEARLRADIAAQAPPWQRAGTDRLLQHWASNHTTRWERSLSLLAAALSRAARDAEEPQGWWPGGKARDAARTALLERLTASLDALHRDLLQLHGVDGLVFAQSVEGRSAEDFLHRGTAAGAGAVAGLAAGALAGAKIDLLTGGLTMGAGAAVGALIGGAGAFGAARFLDWGGAVRLADEQLQALAESLVLQYLAVIHAGRMPDVPLAHVPAAWRSESVAAVAAQSTDLIAACHRARAAQRPEEGDELLRAPLRAACSATLRQLYPGRTVFETEA